VLRAALLFALAMLPAPGPTRSAWAQAGAEGGAPRAEPGLPSNPDALKNRSGLPVPRFASLRAERAFLRAGPGKEYPVQWVFIRPGTPLEVVYEWNLWRKVRDAEGTEGWMDRAMLSTNRTLQIVRQTRNLHARPDVSSPVVMRAEPGVVGRITLCEGRWCRIEIEGRAGYILREHGFGTYPGEPVG
jgi:SH3-like domain-containing protein